LVINGVVWLFGSSIIGWSKRAANYVEVGIM